MWRYFLVICFFAVKAIEIEDFQKVFQNKDCVEASLISISSSQDADVMLDKTVQNIRVINTTQTLEDKSITSRINELAQLNEITSEYELVSEEGPAHRKLFTIVLKLGDEKYEGTGSSFKTAKRQAAALALRDTFYEHPPIKLKAEGENVLTPKSLLNNVSQKLGFAVSYFLLNGKTEKSIESYGASQEAYGKSKSFFPKINSSHTMRIPTEEPQITGPFSVKVKLMNLEFIGMGHTINSAEHDAATKALKYMEKTALLKDNVCNDDDTLEECKRNRETLKSPISRINEAAQKLQISFDCDVVSESGKSHKKVFVTQCKLGEFVTEGEGSSKKESKRIAAEKMVDNLQFFLDTDIVNTNSIVNGLGEKKKKKKKKIIKHNVKNLGEQVGSILTSFWGSQNQGEMHDKSDKRRESRTRSSSPKDKILEMGNSLSIQVEFTDLDNFGNNFYTLMFLGVHPSHICLGKEITRDKAHNKAALHGLKFLYKSGVLDKTEFSHFKEDYFYFKEISISDDPTTAILENPDKKYGK